jgi:hypothetical protein
MTTSSDHARLVFNAKFASRSGEEPETLAAKRLRRFYLQAIARELLPEARVNQCLRSVVPGTSCVNIHYSKKWSRAHYGNLVQCASVWVDPVCSSKITERRRVELEEALGRSPWPGVMITLTLQHSREDKLASLRHDLNEGTRALRSDRWWTDFSKRIGIVGSITSTETTYGLESGHHPHKHILELVDGHPDTEQIQAEVGTRYREIMTSRGRYVSPEIGVHVRATDRGAADYISKWGAAFEITKAGAKRGRGDHYNPFELLQLYAEGKSWAGEVFREYAAAMKGVNQIRWSRGLRELLNLGAEVTDRELVEAPLEDDVILAALTVKQWGVILKRERRGELLEVASTGDAGLLRSYLLALGVFLDS